MAVRKAKGSIIYEFLIVVLAVVLVGSIIYPKKITEEEGNKTQVCQQRMASILDAEVQYIVYNSVYSDTLTKVIGFLRTDSRYEAYVDSVIKGGLDSIVTRLNEFKRTEEHILSQIPSAQDTTMIDSLSNMQQTMKTNSRGLAGFVEHIHDRMRGVPKTPIEDLIAAFKIVDSKKFTLEMDIARNSIESGNLVDAEKSAAQVVKTIDSVIDQFTSVLDQLPSFRGGELDSLYNCPTVNRPYRLVHVDTAVIKYLHIYCPLDSTDIEAIGQDFLKAKVGGLELINHGKIEKGEKSWEST